MPRDAQLFGRFPAAISELIRLIDGAEVPLVAQGIDAGGSAAVAHEDGRLVFAIQAPTRIRSLDELDRCRPGARPAISAPGDEAGDEADESTTAGLPRYWQDAWISFDDLELGERLLTELAGMVMGELVLAPKVRLDGHR